MTWRRFAWLIVFLLIATISWAGIQIRETYQEIGSARLHSTDDPSQRLLSIQRKILDYEEHVSQLEKLVLWESGRDFMSWLTQQAGDTSVQIIGVEHEPVVEVSEYHNIPVKVTIRGNYDPLGRFLNRLEHCSSLVRINSLRMRRKEYTPEQITLNLSLSYVQRQEKS